MSKLARDNRNRDLGLIHQAKGKLLEAGVFQSDDDYRAMLMAQAKVSSSAELDFTGRQRVLKHLRSLGYAGSNRVKAKRTALTPQERLMWSLWQQLADAKVVNDRRMSALVAYAKRQTGVERLEWLKPRQVDLVIESLKQWLGRVPAGGTAA